MPVTQVQLKYVQAGLRPGSILPWSVLDADGTLLLAKGQPIDSATMLENLLRRGVIAEYRDSAKAAATPVGQASVIKESLEDRYSVLESRLGALLKDVRQPDFLARLAEVSAGPLELARNCPDPLSYLVLYPSQDKARSYGVKHSLEAAAVVALLSGKMPWTAEELSSLLGAALTMNVSIVDLQSQLASYPGRLNASHRELIQAHPRRSAQILRESGVSDARWLAIVEDHHEVAGGQGYPGSKAEPEPLSQVLRLIDIFLAKHTPRAFRQALPAKQAAQELYRNSGQHPVASLLIKELGVYPAGCRVRLANGELGIVVRRGLSATTPVVAVLLSRAGNPLGVPVRRDTANPEFSIVSALPDGAIKVKYGLATLYDRTEL